MIELDEMPTVVTICGSTRFWAQMAEANFEETAAGRIVLAPGVNMKESHPLWADPDQAEALKQRLDALHLTKILLSDEVLVVSDASGYIGESTRREIAYAKSLGRPVRYWTPPGVAGDHGARAGEGEGSQR
jgi:hypothetical protein